MGLHLTVVTPTGQAFDGAVEQVVLPGTEGDFGVLEQHERFLSALRPGPVEIKTAAGSQWAAISDGFADVSAEAVTVLVSRCDLAAKLDRAAAQTEVGDLEARLAALPAPGADARAEGASLERAELERELEAARVRLDVAGR